MGQIMKAVIFDMDGVIFDSEKVICDLWEELAKEYNLTNMEELMIKCIGLNDKATYQCFKDMYGEDVDYEFYKGIVSKRYHEKYDGGRLPMKPGVKELLSYLKEKGIKVALASSTRTSTVVSQLKDAGIYEYFDKVICGDMVERSKPEPDIFLKAAEELGVSAEEAFIIEDSYNGIRAAHAAKAKPVMVPDLIAPNDEISALTHKILPDLNKVRDYFEEIGDWEVFGNC